MPSCILRTIIILRLPSSTLITQKHSRQKKTTEEIEEIYAQNQTPFWTYFRLELYIYSIRCPCSFSLITYVILPSSLIYHHAVCVRVAQLLAS